MPSPRTPALGDDLKNVIAECRRSFITLGVFSLAINLLMLLPSL